jgi:hypothetical protein
MHWEKIFVRGRLFCILNYEVLRKVMVQMRKSIGSYTL